MALSVRTMLPAFSRWHRFDELKRMVKFVVSLNVLARTGPFLSHGRSPDRHLGDRHKKESCIRPLNSLSRTNGSGDDYPPGETLQGAKAITAEQLAASCAEFASAKKAEEIVVLDLRGISTFTDFFVICSATSEPQLKAIAGEIEGRLRDEYRIKPAAICLEPMDRARLSPGRGPHLSPGKAVLPEDSEGRAREADQQAVEWRIAPIDSCRHPGGPAPCTLVAAPRRNEFSSSIWSDGEACPSPNYFPSGGAAAPGAGVLMSRSSTSKISDWRIPARRTLADARLANRLFRSLLSQTFGPAP